MTQKNKMLSTAASNTLTRQLKKKKKQNKLSCLKDMNLELENTSKQCTCELMVERRLEKECFEKEKTDSSRRM